MSNLDLMRPTNLPMQMNLVKIKVAQVRISHTYVDKVYKEAVGKENRKQVEFYAQNNSGIQNRKQASATGDKIRTAGHLVAKRKDLEEKSIELKRGDYIVEIAGDKVNFEIVEVRPESPLGGKPLLTYIDYMAAKERSSV